ncbi:MAG: response regulator [Spartobacteria bacterium]|nr:response regulator [Spartobacteria bacterium]
MNVQDNPSPIRLLLLEDSRESGQAMRLSLERKGLKVTIVPSGEEAVQLFNPEMYDIVVADIRLDGMSGVDFLRHVRNELPDFPVILLTGFESLESAIQAVRLRAQDYILKPLDSIEDLLGPIQRAVRNHHLLLLNRQLEAQLRSLAAKLTLAEEKERHKLASDLHDSIGQSLAVADLKLQELLALPHEDAIKKSMRDIRELLAQTIQQTRTLTFELSPPALYEIGLDAALDQLVEHMTAFHHLPISFIGYRHHPLDINLSILIFRAGRELLTNVIKHAHASRVAVKLQGNDEHIQLIVEDDGIGFDMEKGMDYFNASTKFGLFSLQERLGNIGGQLSVESTPAVRTCVCVTVPLKNKES